MSEKIRLSEEITSEVLTQALPYIQKYKDKTIVIKYGGNAMINEELKDAVMGDIVLLNAVGINVVLVHGGGPEITDMLTRVGKKSEFRGGLRVTDKETVEIVQMVLAGKVNKSLVSLVGAKGGRAIGLCGLDGGMIEAECADPELGYVGNVKKVNVQPIKDMLREGYIPVISTVGFDKQGNVYNINADTAAAKIAGALDTTSFIIMTDTPGVLRDKDDPETLISRIDVSEIDSFVKEGVICGGMIPKVNCCREAIECGVSKVFIIDGRIPHSILIEMMTKAGLGTMFVSNKGEI